MNRRIIRYFGTFLILAGFAFYAFSIYLMWERNNPDRLAFKNYTGNYKHVSLSKPPARIIVKELGIDLPIFPANVVNSKWDTTTDGASYLISSPIPGESGNSIIYGHDWESLFGPLHRAQKDMNVEIVYEDGTSKKFVIGKTMVVGADHAEVLKPTEDIRLTLYTCAGFLDSQRVVAVAFPVDEAKNENNDKVLTSR